MEISGSILVLRCPVIEKTFWILTWTFCAAFWVCYFLSIQYYWRDRCFLSFQSNHLCIWRLVCIFFLFSSPSSASFFLEVLILALLVALLWTFVTYPKGLQAWGGGIRDCPQFLASADLGRSSVTISAATPGLLCCISVAVRFCSPARCSSSSWEHEAVGSRSAGDPA